MRSPLLVLLTAAGLAGCAAPAATETGENAPLLVSSFGWSSSAPLVTALGDREYEFEGTVSGVGSDVVVTIVLDDDECTPEGTPEPYLRSVTIVLGDIQAQTDFKGRMSYQGDSLFTEGYATYAYATSAEAPEPSAHFCMSA